MKIQNILVVASSSLILLSLAACSALQPAAPAQPAPTAQSQPGTGVQYHFVTNQLLLPATQSQAEEYALNVDGDAGGSGENHFGRLLSLLTSAAPELELQATLDDGVDTGKLVSPAVGAPSKGYRAKITTSRSPQHACDIQDSAPWTIPS